MLAKLLKADVAFGLHLVCCVSANTHTSVAMLFPLPGRSLAEKLFPEVCVLSWSLYTSLHSVLCQGTGDSQVKVSGCCSVRVSETFHMGLGCLAVTVSAIAVLVSALVSILLLRQTA